MKKNGHMTCEDCKWWGAERKHNNDGPYGKCCVNPPVITRSQALTYHDPDRPGVAGPIVDRAYWPWTAFDDWCGRYQPHD